MPTDASPADFSAFSPRLQKVASIGVVRHYRRGVILMQEGEPGGTLFFVLSGLLSAYRERADGRSIIFGFYEAGKTLGELTLAGGNRTASVAVEVAATCSFVTRTTLLRCIEEEPPLALELLALVAQRAVDVTNQATELALGDRYDRLKRLLLAGAVAEPGGRLRMTYPLTQEQIAGRIGSARSGVTQLLGDLVEGGYLRQERHGRGRVWVILKPLPEHL